MFWPLSFTPTLRSHYRGEGWNEEWTLKLDGQKIKVFPRGMLEADPVDLAANGPRGGKLSWGGKWKGAG